MQEIIMMLLSSITFSTSICINEEVVAKYYDNKVIICEQKKEPLLFHAVVHELGHHLHSKLNDREKRAVTILYIMSKNSNDFTLEYGRTNEAEDFATVFEYMYIYGSNVKYESYILNTKVRLMNYFITKYKKELN